jgi:hypothetical protein
MIDRKERAGRMAQSDISDAIVSFCLGLLGGAGTVAGYLTKRFRRIEANLEEKASAKLVSEHALKLAAQEEMNYATGQRLSAIEQGVRDMNQKIDRILFIVVKEAKQ